MDLASSKIDGGAVAELSHADIAQLSLDWARHYHVDVKQVSLPSRSVLSEMNREKQSEGRILEIKLKDVGCLVAGATLKRAREEEDGDSEFLTAAEAVDALMRYLRGYTYLQPLFQKVAGGDFCSLNDIERMGTELYKLVTAGGGAKEVTAVCYTVLSNCFLLCNVPAIGGLWGRARSPLPCVTASTVSSGPR
mmetsp:Transcript_33287/g.81730  ORF Transcript_33287/g.81730 Transcript_33287/m.81730 type:complete len:193 (-) Transcript_33287:326-904(-)